METERTKTNLLYPSSQTPTSSTVKFALTVPWGYDF
jgi:hypothetical protein